MYFENYSISGLSDGSFKSMFKYVPGDELISRDEADNSTKINPEFQDDYPNGQAVWVHISPQKVEFYVPIYINGNPVNTEPSIPIYEIPLDSPEEIRQALLFLELQSGKLLVTNENKGYLLYHTKFIKNKQLFEVPGLQDGHTLYELVLAFFYELNYPGSVFVGQYPEIANLIKTELEKCKLYQLINKKFNFYYALHDFSNSNKDASDKKKLKNAFNIYLNEVLDGSIQNEVPGIYMGNEHWFNTPEVELEDISSINLEYFIDLNRTEHIQKALLAKHDVVKAMKIKTSSVYIPFTANIITALLYLGVFVYWLTNHYTNSFWILCLAFGFLVFGMIVHTIQQRAKLSMFLPRIIVTIATAWFLLIASEEILKNQINIDKNLIIIGLPLVFLLLFIFIFAEIRQHSPYYNDKKRSRIYGKTVLIIIYSFNIAVSFGLFAHPFVVNEYILKSKVYEDYIYSNQKDNLELLKNEYTNYRSKLLSVQSVNSIAFSLIQKQVLKSTTTISLPDSLLVYKENLVKSDKSLFSLYKESYNKNISSIDISGLDTVLKKDFISRLVEYKDTINLELINPENIKKYSNPGELWINEILIKNNYRISQIGQICDKALVDIGDRILQANNVDTLASYNTYYDYFNHKDSSVLEQAKIYRRDSLPQHGLLYNPTNIHRYQYIINDKVYTVFPLMLIFQTLIVLLIAIVGQLILSEKTITESL